MIRTSKSSLKFSNKEKQNYLKQLFYDYKLDLQFYLDLIHSKKLEIKNNLSSKILPINIISHSQWRQIIYKQASEIYRSNLQQQYKKRYKKYKQVYSYFFKRNRQMNFLSKRYHELNLKLKQAPIIKNCSINIDNRLFDIKQSQNEFDYFIKLRLPYFCSNKKRAIAVNFPIRSHKHMNKFSDWNRKNTIQLKQNSTSFSVSLFFEKQEPTVKSSGKSIGIDLGYKKLIVTSDGNIYGREFEQLYEKISRKKQGSKNFKQLLKHRNNLINQIINKLDLSNTNKIYIEDLKNVKKDSKKNRTISSRFMNKLQRWSYSKTIQKLEHICQETGVALMKVSPSYTSQICSNCRSIHKESRIGETYYCIDCGYEIDADINAAINILHRGVYNLSANLTLC